MPITIALRKKFSDSYYRDSFARALRSESIDSAYIASGFFTDFTNRLEVWSPDFSVNTGMKNKKVFLLGGYEDDASELIALKDALVNRGVDAHASKLAAPQQGEDTLQWHAKVAVFLNGTQPVLAIVGSSNFTGSTMYGGSEHKSVAPPARVKVEADSYYWLKSHVDADQAIYDVFNHWGGGRQAPHIAFNAENFDQEIELVLNSIYWELLSFHWQTL